MKDRVVSLMGGVFDRGEDVFSLKRRVIREDFLERSACRQELKDIGDTDPQSANARPATAFPFFHGNPLQSLVIHTSQITCSGVDRQGRRKDRTIRLFRLPALSG